MSIKQVSISLTQHSNGLRPIYEKVEELLKSKQIQIEADKRKTPVRIIQPVPKLELKLNIDRKNQIAKKRENKPQINQFSIKKQFDMTKVTSFNQPEGKQQARTKTQRILNFLKQNRSEKKFKKSQIPITPIEASPFQRQSFTPMRPISKTSRLQQSVSGTSFTRKSSHNKSSAGGYSQVARLSQASKSTKQPSKYLRKGHRMRQTLMKQIQAPQDIEEQKQLVYLKQYDQWVPASLASFKKLQLQHFLNILLGGKKIQKRQLANFQPIYL